MQRWHYGTHLACELPWTEFDRYELQIYEEVAKMPPFQRKTLVLIGAQGVGRRSLKNRLIVMNPLRYGTTVPCECVRQTAEVVTLSATRFPARVHVTPLLTFHLQSRHAVRGKRRETARTTALWHGKRWRGTSRTAVTWSMASTMATFMAPIFTLSMKWWTQAVPASWTSTLRLVKGTHFQCVDLFFPP